MMKLNGPLMELHEGLMERNQTQKKLRQRSIVLHECWMELREWAMKRRKCSTAPPEFAMARGNEARGAGKTAPGRWNDGCRAGKTRWPLPSCTPDGGFHVLHRSICPACLSSSVVALRSCLGSAPKERWNVATGEASATRGENVISQSRPGRGDGGARLSFIHL